MKRVATSQIGHGQSGNNPIGNSNTDFVTPSDHTNS